MNKKIIIGLFIMLIAMGTLLPYAIEYYVNRIYDSKTVRETLIKNIKDRTGMSMSVDGSHYKIFQGFILSGVKLRSPKSSGYILRSESLIIEVSLFNFFRNRNPFSSVYLNRARLNPWAISAHEWSLVFQKFSHFGNASAVKEKKSPKTEPVSSQRKAYALPDALDIQADNMEIILPRAKDNGNLNTSEPKRIRIFATLLASPIRSKYDVALRLAEDPTHDSVLSFYNGKKADTNFPRFHFRINKLPVNIAHRLSYILPMSADVRYLLSNVKLSTGTLTGKGSFDILKKGLGINIESEYTNVNLLATARGDEALRCISCSGKLQYTLAYENPKKELDYVDLKIRQKGMSLSLRHGKKGPKKKGSSRTSEITIKGHLEFSQGISEDMENRIEFRVLGFSAEGRVDFDVSYPLSTAWIRPHLLFKVKNFKLYPYAAIFPANAQQSHAKEKKSGPKFTISISEFTATQLGGSQMTISGHGKIATASYSIKGTADSDFWFNATGESAGYTLRQKLDLKVMIQGMQYDTVIPTLLNIIPHIKKSAVKPDARRIENMAMHSSLGYLALYYNRPYLQYLNGGISLEFSGLKDPGGSLPKDLQLDFYKHGNYISAKLKPILTEKSEMEFEYFIILSNPMPYHKAEFKLLIKENRLKFPTLTGPVHAPKSIYIKYNMAGAGWFPRDLINHTITSLYFNAEKADLSFLPPTKAMHHKLGIKSKGFLADRYSFQRYTMKNDYTYRNILIESPNISIKGFGSYDPGVGGSFTLYYNGPKKKPGKIQFNILANDIWVPSVQ